MENVPRVTVYSTPTCPWCQAVKRYLRQRGIPFRDVDVSRDRREAERMIHRSGQSGVPVVEIDGTMIVGFDRARIDRALNLR